MSKGLLIDLTKCIGCRGCQAACKQWNDLPGEQTRNNGSYQNPPRLSSKTWTVVTFDEIEEKGKLEWVFAKRQCMHCEHPSCATACLVGALKKTPEGAVAYDAKKCIGCRYCMLACPFNVPTFEWDKAIPLIRKCDMCVDRVQAGMKTACAQACPTDAITFGERDELLVTAQKRIDAAPGKYEKEIYGAKEGGGTSVLYLSHVPFATIGFPTLGPKRISTDADVAMRAVPALFVAASAALTGLYWFFKRRGEGMAQEEEPAKEVSS